MRIYLAGRTGILRREIADLKTYNKRLLSFAYESDVHLTLTADRLIKYGLEPIRRTK